METINLPRTVAGNSFFWEKLMSFIKLKKCTNVLFSVIITMSFAAAFPALAATEDGDLEGEKLAQLLQDAGISCSAERKFDCTAGDLATGDYYDVSIHSDCKIAPYYGGVFEKPVVLRKRVATTGYKESGAAEALAKGQLVCIKATAKSGSSDAEYFVMALPSQASEKCDSSGTSCRASTMPAEPFQTMMKDCRYVAKQGYKSCPQGWVHADAIEPYPMGLPE